MGSHSSLPRLREQQQHLNPPVAQYGVVWERSNEGLQLVPRLYKDLRLGPNGRHERDVTWPFREIPSSTIAVRPRQLREHRSVHPDAEGTLEPQLLTYLAWPMLESIRDEARLGPLVEVRHCIRPADIDESLDPSLTAQPTTEVVADSAARRFAWARGLTDMRKRQSSETAARILIGGKLEPASGFLGRLPGVLEEALATLETKRPLFIIGAF